MIPVLDAKLKAKQTIEEDKIIISWHIRGRNHPKAHLAFRHKVSIPKEEKELANRLCKAIEAGVVVTDIYETVDISNRHYLTSSFRILMRTASRDLRRLGF